MSLLVYTGLPATGKTKAIITALEERKKKNSAVLLFISSEHEELTNRSNVRDRGLMGCRDKTKSFPIDHVVDTKTAVRLMADLTEDSRSHLMKLSISNHQLLIAGKVRVKEALMLSSGPHPKFSWVF